MINDRIWNFWLHSKCCYPMPEFPFIKFSFSWKEVIVMAINNKSLILCWKGPFWLDAVLLKMSSPGPATLASSRNMLETQIFRPHCRFTKFETMGMEPSILCFNNRPYGWFWWLLKFEKYWSTGFLFFIVIKCT